MKKTKDKNETAKTSSHDFGFISHTKHITNDYKIYLNNSVEHFDIYQEIISLLDEAEDHDSVTFVLQNFGGSCHSCLALTNSIKLTKALVTMRVLAPCYSAGSTLALSGDLLEMYPHSSLMFHDYSTTYEGHSKAIEDSLKDDKIWIHGYMKEIHLPFLTLKEHKLILSGVDPITIHYSTPDLKSRVTRHCKKHCRFKQISENKHA